MAFLVRNIISKRISNAVMYMNIRLNSVRIARKHKEIISSGIRYSCVL